MYRTVYPLAAVVGQEAFKQGLLLAAVNPAIGGILIRGRKGNGQVNHGPGPGCPAAEMPVVRGCPFSCSPEPGEDHCPDCRSRFPQLEVTTRPARLVATMHGWKSISGCWRRPGAKPAMRPLSIWRAGPWRWDLRRNGRRDPPPGLELACVPRQLKRERRPTPCNYRNPNQAIGRPGVSTPGDKRESRANRERTRRCNPHLSFAQAGELHRKNATVTAGHGKASMEKESQKTCRLLELC